VSEPRQNTNSEVSDLASTNPSDSRCAVKRLYQARGEICSGGKHNPDERGPQNQTAEHSRLFLTEYHGGRRSSRPADEWATDEREQVRALSELWRASQLG